MEARELRIGNYIAPIGKIHTGIGGYDHYTIRAITEECVFFNQSSVGEYHKDIKPLPLTEDWLVRLGFEFTNGHFIKGKANLRLFTNGECQFIFRFRYMVSIYYVHQLQNLFFALTGEELTPN